jgi:hypothetical protein
MKTAILAAMALVALSSNPFTHREIASHCHNATPSVATPKNSKTPRETGSGSATPELRSDAPQAQGVAHPGARSVACRAEKRRKLHPDRATFQVIELPVSGRWNYRSSVRE